MFLLSLKSLKGKMILLIAAIIAAIAVLVIINTGDAEAQAAKTDSAFNFSASTDDERLNFIAQLGCTVENEPVSVSEVLIPQEFDEVYKQYNELQLSSGFDLNAYKGCTVKKWTYQVTSCPEFEDCENIRLTLLVYKGKIIGGDICSTELDGSILPLFEE